MLLATGFGLGYSPVASGTVGSLLGVLIVLAENGLGLSVGWQIVSAAILALVSIPICDVAEKSFPKKDDGRIVADEYLTFPICMLGLPCQPWVVAMAFLSCRVLDIVKPPPARQIQAVPGGLGVALDDIVSSLYALAVNHALFWAVGRYLAT
jgi:phosphatidylglycerophosphatase A